ncbi:MAG: PIN domain-containing protein [Spirochaetales bacterium]|jgi:predicted nucleic acid-binding protein|nr:PIN domain-containing protein [Spirochaetales bacterium]
MENILADAGPLIALFDRDDKYHETIKQIVRSRRYRFVTTTAVLTEVTHMLDFNVDVQVDFLTWVMVNGLDLWEFRQEDLPRVIELTRKYRDRPMDFADATLVIVAEKTGIHSILSIDSDFDVYRLPGKVKIKNVFREV